MSGQVNRFRKRIGLDKTTRDALHEDRVPFVYVRRWVPRPHADRSELLDRRRASTFRLAR